jgi:hypothetical protein
LLPHTVSYITGSLEAANEHYICRIGASLQATIILNPHARCVVLRFQPCALGTQFPRQREQLGLAE